MSDNLVSKKNFLNQATELIKNNLKNIIIFLFLCFFLFLSFQIYSFYISKKIRNHSISFFSAQNSDDSDLIKDTFTNLSNDNDFYSVLAKLELIENSIKEKNIQETVSMYLEVINQKNLDTVYKSAIAAKASYQLIDINFDDLSANYLDPIEEFISYIDETLDSYKGIKLELHYLTIILDAEKNSIDYLSAEGLNDIYDNIMNSDVVSSVIKERVNKIHEFYSNK